MSTNIEDKKEEFSCVNCKILNQRIIELEKEIKNIKIKKKKKDKERLTNISIPLNLSFYNIENKLNEYYTEDIFYKGHLGLSYFIINYIIENNYICINKEKFICIYLDNNEEYEDKNCKYIIDRVYPFFLEKSKVIYKKLINEVYNNEDNDEDNDSDLNDIIENELFIKELNKELNKDEKKELNKDEKNYEVIDNKVNLIVSCYMNIKSGLKKYRKIIVKDIIDNL